MKKKLALIVSIAAGVAALAALTVVIIKLLRKGKADGAE